MWAQIINTLIGLWLMIAPGIFPYDAVAADNGHIIGPVIITFSITAYWECTRNLRLWNLPLAAWLLIAPWVLGYENIDAMRSDMICGMLVIILSLIKGKVEQSYGGGWKSLWDKDSLHFREAEKQSQKETNP